MQTRPPRSQNDNDLMNTFVLGSTRAELERTQPAKGDLDKVDVRDSRTRGIRKFVHIRSRAGELKKRVGAELGLGHEADLESSPVGQREPSGKIELAIKAISGTVQCEGFVSSTHEVGVDRKTRDERAEGKRLRMSRTALKHRWE